ncbi:MAG: NusG domain II-containing protein [Treponema sp.]|nr:NusG domain II-containing protein [Treponema sp.]
MKHLADGKIKILDFLVIFLMLSLGIFLTVKNLFTPKERVYVKACGENYEFSANVDSIHKIAGELGETVFEIKNGKIRIIDSPCPNKICVHQGWDSPLVCLPNNVIIYLGKTSEDFDALSN